LQRQPVARIYAQHLTERLTDLYKARHRYVGKLDSHRCLAGRNFAGD
jgi:hypothetical protein